MRVMVIIKANEDSEAGAPPDEQMLIDMGKYNDELIEAGIMLSAEGLQSSAHGKRVRFSGTNRTVIDGPFAETKELIAGFWIWQVKSMDEAIEWIKRCPNTSDGEEEIELRPIGEMEDLEPFMQSDEGKAALAAELEYRDAKKS